MDRFAARIEALEHAGMRAWMNRDRSHLKAMAASDFIFLLGGSRAVILDHASWLKGVTSRFACSSYRFGDVYVRRHGRLAVFCARLELEATLADVTLSGSYWLSDIWRPSRVTRSWRLLERALSRPDDDEHLQARVRELQLWR